jgi:hypothetical protein
MKFPWKFAAGVVCAAIVFAVTDLLAYIAVWMSFWGPFALFGYLGLLLALLFGVLAAIIIFRRDGGVVFGLGILGYVITLPAQLAVEHKLYEVTLPGIEVRRSARAHTTIHYVSSENRDDRHIRQQASRSIEQYGISVFLSTVKSGKMCEIVGKERRSGGLCRNGASAADLPSSYLRLVSGCIRNKVRGVQLAHEHYCLDIYEVDGEASTHLGRVIVGKSQSGLVGSSLLANIASAGQSSEYPLLSPRSAPHVLCASKTRRIAGDSAYQVALTATLLDEKCELRSR